MNMQPKIHIEIEQLQRQLLAMGAAVEQNIGDAVRAVIERDDELARAVVGRDPSVDLAEIRIDRHCLDILALHQPVARDLRVVATAMKIVKDLERVGDTAADIARLVPVILRTGVVRDLEDLPRMCRLAQRMLSRALDAFVRQDVELARLVIQEDDLVDDLETAVIRQIQTLLSSGDGPVAPSMRLLQLAHFLERIGDHSCNIAEMVVFLVEGQDIRHLEKLQGLNK